MKYLKIIILISILILLKSCFSNFGFDTGLTKTFTSQDGTIKITVKQDFASRPYVFYKGKQIFSYSGSGFMETVDWNVTFVDENTIILSTSQFNESYTINLE